MKGKSLVIIAGLSFSLFAGATLASAHGYVMEPQSRVYKGTAAVGLNKNVGQGMYEPQSIEAHKGFPERPTSPQDGKIASGAKAGFEPLDEQSATRWHKTAITTGKMDVTWYLTARHKTESWDYFMTKPGWNPNQPLNRQSLERIGRIDWQGEMPEQVETQTITIPADRQGYHVIVAIWNIADTENGFYQAIDVNVSGTGTLPKDTEAPSIPTRVQSEHVRYNQVMLNWQASTDNVGVTAYEILRDGQVVGTSKTTTYTDDTVLSSKSYTYTIRALDKAGNRSVESQPLTVQTPAKPVIDTEAPSIPSGLMAHMTTKTSTMLHWQAAVDNVGVAYYEVLRDGRVVAKTANLMYTDNQLQPATNYRYAIVAVDQAGNRSAKSQEIHVTTDKDDTTGNQNGQGKDTWLATTTYTGGEIVRYNGLEYKAKWWTLGNNPETSDVWEMVSKGQTMNWNQQKAYVGGEKVNYQGKTYQAKWWTQGNIPSISDVWVVIDK